MKIYFLSLMIFMSGCITYTTLERNENAFISRVIKNNDANQLEKFLSTKKLNISEASCALNEAFTETGKDYICRDQIYKLLLEHGAAPTESLLRKQYNGYSSSKHPFSDLFGTDYINEHNYLCERELNLTNAIHANCTDAVKILLSKLSNNEIVLAVKNRFNSIPKAVVDKKSPEFNERQELRKKVFEINQLLLNNLKLSCEKDGIASDSCAAVERINTIKSDDEKDLSEKNKEFLKKLEENAAFEKKMADENLEKNRQIKENIKNQEIYENSAEASKNSACDDQRIVNFEKGLLSNEDQVSKRSGVENLTNRDRITRRLIIAEKSVKRFNQKYKDKTGQYIDFSTCPKVNY